MRPPGSFPATCGFSRPLGPPVYDGMTFPVTRPHLRSVIVAPTAVQQNSPLICPTSFPAMLISNRQLCPTPSVDPIAQPDGLMNVFGLEVI